MFFLFRRPIWSNYNLIIHPPFFLAPLVSLLSSFRVSRRRENFAEVIRSVAYICGIYCHSVRTRRGAPASPRRGLFATSSAIPGIVEGVHCAAAIPVCVPHRYPLSDALETHEQTHTDEPFSPSWGNPPSLRLPFYRRPTYVCEPMYTRAYVYIYIHACRPPLF